MVQYDRIVQADVQLKNGQAVRIPTELRISFSIEKSKTKNNNSATIEIFGLSGATRSQMLERNLYVKLSAGYVGDGGLKTLFIGRAQYVHHMLELPGVKTVIETQDGAEELRENRVTVSLGEGATTQSALESVTSQVGLPLTGVTLPGTFAGGFSYSGPAKTALEEITKRVSHEWSVQDGQIQVIPRNGNNGQQAILVSESSGMVFTPERINYNKSKLNEDNKEGTTSKASEGEWSIRTLLQPEFKPGAVVKIESASVNGFFTIERVTHSGDNFSGDWQSTIEVKAVPK